MLKTSVTSPLETRSMATAPNRMCTTTEMFTARDGIRRMMKTSTWAEVQERLPPSRDLTRARNTARLPPRRDLRAIDKARLPPCRDLRTSDKARLPPCRDLRAIDKARLPPSRDPA